VKREKENLTLYVERQNATVPFTEIFLLVEEILKLPSTRSCLLDKHCTKPANHRGNDVRFSHLARSQRNTIDQAQKFQSIVTPATSLPEPLIQ